MKMKSENMDLTWKQLLGNLPLICMHTSDQMALDYDRDESFRKGCVKLKKKKKSQFYSNVLSHCKLMVKSLCLPVQHMTESYETWLQSLPFFLGLTLGSPSWFSGVRINHFWMRVKVRRRHIAMPLTWLKAVVVTCQSQDSPKAYPALSSILLSFGSNWDHMGPINFMLCWRRLDWDHKLIRNLLAEVINQVGSRVVLS